MRIGGRSRATYVFWGALTALGVVCGLAFITLVMPDQLLMLRDLDTELATSGAARIGLARFWVGIATVFAFTLAAYQFYLAQRRAILGVYARDRGTGDAITSVVANPVERNEIEAGIRLELVLVNTGPNAARWIKIKVRVDPIKRGPRIRQSRTQELGGLGQWSTSNDGRTHTFIGSDSFICYPQQEDPEVAFQSPELFDNLGRLTMQVDVPPTYVGRVATLHCSIWADGARPAEHELEVGI